MNALEVGLMTLMTGDSGAGGLAALSNGGIFQMTAPRTAAFNYTVLQKILRTPNYAFGNSDQAKSFYYQIKHYSIDEANNSTKSGQEVSGSMADRAIILLTNPSLSVSGQTVLCCRFNRSIPDMKEWDEPGGRFIYSKGAIYEIWLA